MLPAQKELAILANPAKAEVHAGFFKAGKGEYGEGDVFIGVTVPQTRKIALANAGITLSDVKVLLDSKIHEERLCGALILVEKFRKSDEIGKTEVYDFYMKNLHGINNWDLVDLTADKIVGAHLAKGGKKVIYQLAKSKNLWERRIAIISTYHFIKNKEHEDTFNIAQMLLDDKEDLMHKATGWMLREVGKRIGEKTEEKFLKKHYRQMPRTMLRYAIERFPAAKKKAYMEGKI